MSVRNSQQFRPTPAMELYAYKRAKVGEDASNKSVAESIGITRETASRWKAISGFLEWLDERVACYRTPILEMLEQVALNNLDDYRYWEAMAKKFGYVTPEVASPPEDDGGKRMSPAEWATVLKERHGKTEPTKEGA